MNVKKLFRLDNQQPSIGFLKMWIDIKFNTNYEISDTGIVRRKSNKNVLKGCITSGYRSVKLTFEKSRQQRFYVHRLVALHFIPSDDRNKTFVNHKNGNKLDNRKSNLRICSPSENSMNKGVQNNNKLGFKGVTKTAEGNYQAIITFNSKPMYLGRYATPELAFKSYELVASSLFGEFYKPTSIPTNEEINVINTTLKGIKKHPKKVSAEELQIIESFLSEGKTQREIARILGRDVSTIGRAVKKMREENEKSNY